MAQEELSDEEQDELEREFEKARQGAGEDTFEANHKLVVDMGSMLVHV